MVDLNEITRNVLQRGYLLSVGIADADGPWVADVIYTFDDECNIYWMSTPERRHSMAIALNAKIAGAITVTPAPGIPDLGLQMSGEAKVIDDIPFEIVLRYFRKRNQPDPLPTDDVLDEHKWYKFTPSRIELIDQERFAYNRQRVR